MKDESLICFIEMKYTRQKEMCLISDQQLEDILCDIGCDSKMIETSLNYYQSHQIQKQMSLLKRYRCTLLEKIHDDQKQIDCLDYLIYQLKNMEGKQ